MPSNPGDTCHVTPRLLRGGNNSYIIYLSATESVFVAFAHAFRASFVTTSSWSMLRSPSAVSLFGDPWEAFQNKEQANVHRPSVPSRPPPPAPTLSMLSLLVSCLALVVAVVNLSPMILARVFLRFAGCFPSCSAVFDLRLG